LRNTALGRGAGRRVLGGVAANNFYGAAALAVFYPILVWSLWITRQEKRIVVPAIAIPVLAYGLTAFWLVPSYFKVTAENLKYVSEHGTTWSIWVAVAVAVAFAVASDRFARAKPERAWAVFIAGCVVFFSLNVLGGIYFNFRISGDPVRLLPELDMIYIMAAVLMLRWLWGRPGIDLRAVVLVILIAAFWTTTVTSATPGTCFRSRPTTRIASSIASPTGFGRTCPMRVLILPGTCASGTTPGTTFRS